MAASAFLVTLPAACGRTLYNGHDAMIVYAEDATDAKAIAAAYYSSSDSDTAWTAASAVATALVAAADLEGWKLRVAVRGMTPAIDLTVVGAASATVDTIAALMVTALNATVIDNASYNSTTNILTIAAIADGIGDKDVIVEMYPPTSNFPIPGFVGAIVDGGIAAAVLTVQLATDAWAKPKVFTAFRQ